MSEADRFPAAVYAETVLSVNFEDAQRYFLDALLDIHYAHTLMLARQGIIAGEVAKRCVEGLDSLDRGELSSARYDGSHEDLFFYVQAALERVCGPENAGQMHTARSRNDIAITQYRMRLRREILAIVSALNEVRRTLLAIAREHIGTLMPAYTHTQPAQPTTLAHYLLAAVEMFGRDERRLQAAFATVNRSPMGACAITTTGFPIDRFFTADLLGFEGLQLNSYGAIAATDYVTETAGAVATTMVNLGKLTQDLSAVVHGGVRPLAAFRCLGPDQQHHAAEAQSGAAGTHARAGQQGAGTGTRRCHDRPQHAVRRHQRQRRRLAAAGDVDDQRRGSGAAAIRRSHRELRSERRTHGGTRQRRFPHRHGARGHAGTQREA